MPPPLPREPSKRYEMWGHLYGNEDLLDRGDPMEPAKHLDEKTQHRIGLFPDMSGLLRSRFGLSRRADQHWFPVRPLGKGGFGGVAVWERRDFLGDVIEETAVKQTEWCKPMALRTQPVLAKEAVIMQQLNKKDSENIVYLKGFKFFKVDGQREATWRFYFEYCPFGDLARLGKRYKVWGTYLPEEFLWRAFHSMATVAQILDDGRYNDLETNAVPEFPLTLIHSDIKPLNIFLGYHVEPNSPWQAYPVIKVGDWGLASLTNVHDAENPEKFVKNGTAWYLPPESRPDEDTEKYLHWESPPFNVTSFASSGYSMNEYNPDYSNRKVDSAHNIWGFGLTMYELLTHESARTFSERLDAMTEEDYIAWGNHSIPPLRTHREPEYTYALRQLVRRCLNLRPGLRPTAREILEVTGPMVEHYGDQVGKTRGGGGSFFQQSTRTYQLPKLYFKENEINHMPLGPHLPQFGVDDQYQAAFAAAEDKYGAPIWGPIQHPNRAQWAGRYLQMMRGERQQAENKGRKNVQVALQPESRSVPQTNRDRVDRRQQPRRLDTVDRALLASGPKPDSDEPSRRFVQRKKMRLWDGQVPAGPALSSYDSSSAEDSAEDGAEDDVSMTNAA